MAWGFVFHDIPATMCNIMTDAPSALCCCCIQGMNVSMDQFVDMCIMCGCDYVNNIRGIGPVRALQLIQKHGTIDVGLLQGGCNLRGSLQWGRGVSKSKSIVRCTCGCSLGFNPSNWIHYIYMESLSCIVWCIILI